MSTSKKSPTEPRSFAIAETSGKQFMFEVDRYYDLDRIQANEKDKITLENVLLIKDNDSISVGTPYVKNAKIELEVISHKRDKKIIVYKMRPKKKTRRKMGHRQELTRVMVKSITINDISSVGSKKKEPAKKTSTTTSPKKETAKKTSSTTSPKKETAKKSSSSKSKNS